MINLTARRCIHPICMIIPSFGIKDRQATHCNIHKLEGMIDVVSAICQSEGCKTSASYLKLYSKTALHCRDHSNLNEYSRRKVRPIYMRAGCHKVANFIDQSDINLYPVRYNTDKFLTDIELVERQCPNCNDVIFVPINKEVYISCGNYRQRILHHFKEDDVKGFFTN